MRLSLTLAAFALFSSLFFAHPQPAQAGLHFCNKTSLTVWVSYAEEDSFFISQSQGWWKIEPSDCAEPITEDLDTSGDTDYYFYAHDSNGGTWSGSDYFCTSSDAYTLDYSKDCPNKKGFRKLDTQKAADFWFNLTP